MDGGICSVPAHLDVVAGSKRAALIPLNDGVTPPFLTGVPHRLADNIRQVEGTGAKVLWILANPPTGISLVDPDQAPALYAGYERASIEAPKIKAFWS